LAIVFSIDRRPNAVATAEPRRSIGLKIIVALVISAAALSWGLPAYAARACPVKVGSAQSSLERQVAAIRRLEQQRQCSTKSKSGFFNACRDLANRREALLVQVNGARGRSMLDCIPMNDPPNAARRPPPSNKIAGSALFCVRLKDGYFFPAPKSQFMDRKELPSAVDQCRFICNDPAVDLYQLSSFELETEDMLSVDRRRPYRELPNAFKYRSESQFVPCDHSRYHRRVEELRAKAGSPEISASAVPLPTFRPETSASSPSLPIEAFSYSDTPLGVSLEKTSSVRNVRIVLPGVGLP
jgi:hypothetical protein